MIKLKNREPIFVHEPIPDQFVTSDERVIALMETLAELLRQGEVLYIHCWGGHGRTGTIIGCLLGSHTTPPAQHIPHHYTTPTTPPHTYRHHY